MACAITFELLQQKGQIPTILSFAPEILIAYSVLTKIHKEEDGNKMAIVTLVTGLCPHLCRGFMGL